MAKNPGAATQNVLDRAIAWFSPERGLARARSRAMIAGLDAYQGGSKTSRAMAGWTTSQGDADADLAPNLQELRKRSRDLSRNAPMGGGALATMVTNVVGTGLSLQSRIYAEALGMDAEQAEEWQSNTEREFRLWAESTFCDITRTQDFYGLQELVFRAVLESGDCFTLLPMVPERGGIYDLRVQVVEADRVCNKNQEPNSPELSMGVALNKYGAPTAYHVKNTHPGSQATSDYTWTVIPAFGGRTGRRNVLHHFRRLRPGQNRGVPFLAPVIESIKQLERYTEAEITAAVISGMFSVFIKTEGGTGIDPVTNLGDETGATQQDKVIKLAPGLISDLRPGESIETVNPGRPNQNFDPFFQAIMGQVGVALEIPKDLLLKAFNASYTASRAAFIEAWKMFRVRRAWLVQSFCQPIYEAWLEEAVARGRVDAPGFFDDPAIRAAYCAAEWHGDAMPQLDPEKEINAAKGRVELGVSDRARETAELTGGDWEMTHRQQVREKQMRLEDGLEVMPPAPGAPPAAPAEPEPDPKDPAEPQEPEEPEAEDATKEALGRVMEAQVRLLDAQAQALARVPEPPAAPNITVQAPPAQPPAQVHVEAPKISLPPVNVTMPPMTLNVTLDMPEAKGGQATAGKTIQVTRDEQGNPTGYVVTETSAPTAKKIITIHKGPDGEPTGITTEE